MACGLLLVAAGCADYVGDDIRSGDATVPEGRDDVGSPTTATTTPPPPVDPRTLPVGACFDDVGEPGAGEDGAGDAPTPARPDDVQAFAQGEQVVPRICTEEHRYELYARRDLAAGGAYPGEGQVAEDADRFCAQRFEEFVGAPWGATSLDYVAQVPGEQRWQEGDRTVACALFDLGLAPLEGSMAGSGGA